MLRTKNLTKIYKQGMTDVIALNDCNIEIKKGEFVAIVGTSGSGKTTLLQLCGGMLSPTSGEIFIEDKDISNLSNSRMAELKRKKIGFIFQQYNLLPFMTAEENIILPSLADKNDYDNEYLSELANLLNITPRLAHFPGQLSGGEQQRVAIARALINKPAIILADEPTGNLDKKRATELLDLLVLSMKTYNQTIMLITHDSSIAERADRILHIEDGVVG